MTQLIKNMFLLYFQSIYYHKDGCYVHVIKYCQTNYHSSFQSSDAASWQLASDVVYHSLQQRRGAWLIQKSCSSGAGEVEHKRWVVGGSIGSGGREGVPVSQSFFIERGGDVGQGGVVAGGRGYFCFWNGLGLNFCWYSASLSAIFLRWGLGIFR